MLGDGEDVLVAAAAHVHDHQMVLRPLGRELDHLGERVRRLERRDDALELRAELEGLEIEWPSRICPSSSMSR